MKSKIQLVYIEFVDHLTVDEWHDIKDIEDEELMVCYAFGYLIKESKKEYKVAAVISDDGQTAARWVIAKSAVTKFKKLKVRVS